MKSVGNLTEFVRGHMLEPFDIAPRIKALIDHFDDLYRAHEAVLKAKRQIDLLIPLVADCERHAETGAEARALRQRREALRPWFATLKLALLGERIARLDEDLTRQNAQIGRCEERRDGQRRDVDALRRDIAENGGDRIERLAAEIETLQGETERRKAKARRYRELVRTVGEQPAGDEAGFLDQRRRFTELEEDFRSREVHLQNELMEQEVSFRRQKDEHDELESEIASLRARQSNIPAREIAMRASLCRELGLAEADLPFAGELLEVREEERDWEGAAERLLRGFGLSLLVPDAHYARVARWVDATHLSGRLVYFRVRERRGSGLSAHAEPRQLHAHSLVRKLSIKPDSAFYEWLERELARRFDVACCVTLEQFRRETRAMTRAGQIKDRGERHEKDDRHRIDDRSGYVLGWTNAAKIAALRAQSRQLEHASASWASGSARCRASNARFGNVSTPCRDSEKSRITGNSTGPPSPRRSPASATRSGVSNFFGPAPAVEHAPRAGERGSGGHREGARGPAGPALEDRGTAQQCPGAAHTDP